MELILYVIFSWLVVAYLVTATQKNEVIRSIIVYSIFTIISTSSFSIISLNLQLIRVSEDKIKFLSLLLNRNIVMPILIIIFINLFYRQIMYKKIVPVVLLLLLFTLIEFMNLKFQIYSYVKWNFGLMFLLNGFFVLITLIASKGINVIQLRSEHK